MVHRKDGGFDEEAALDDLISKYGQIASATSGSKRKLEDGENEEAEAKAEELDKDGAAVISEEEGEGSENEGRKTKKRKAPAVKKTEIVAVEENRAIAEAIQEMATIAFKNKDARKGGMLFSASPSSPTACPVQPLLLTACNVAVLSALCVAPHAAAGHSRRLRQSSQDATRA